MVTLQHHPRAVVVELHHRDSVSCRQVVEVNINANLVTIPADVIDEIGYPESTAQSLSNMLRKHCGRLLQTSDVVKRASAVRQHWNTVPDGGAAFGFCGTIIEARHPQTS